MAAVMRVPNRFRALLMFFNSLRKRFGSPGSRRDWTRTSMTSPILIDDARFAYQSNFLSTGMS